jgi:alpha-galactosidase
MAYRPGRPAPDEGFQGEGLLVLDPADGGAVFVVSASDPTRQIPSIRAVLHGRTMVISADAPVVVEEHPGPLPAALAWWADRLASAVRRKDLPTLPAVWCSWYCYWTGVTASDVEANLLAATSADLGFGVFQVDDGWQQAIGDWHRWNPRFGDLDRLVEQIRHQEVAAGIWLSPFLVAEGSWVAQDHPEWLVAEVDAGFNWGQRLRVLDVTHPGAAEHLRSSLVRLRESGIDYFKVDFLYAGAMEGRRVSDVPAIQAYRDGLQLVRDAVGDDAVILGCGAPMLPSVGLVDAMRVSPDVMPAWEPPDGDLSQPGGRSARAVGAVRSLQHGRLWVNDPDCLLARPAMERRSAWADHLRAVGGLRSSSDPILDLDPWGMETTRELMAPCDPTPQRADAAMLLPGEPGTGT